MKTPEEIAREAVRYDWNTGSAAFHTDRVMLQTYVFDVPCRLIPGATAEAAVAKFETWAAPVRARVAAAIAAAIVAERTPGTPHSCELHRATGGASDCGLSPCEEAKVHADRGPPRRAKVRRNCIEPKPTETLDPNPAEGSKVGGSAGVPPAPACARCGGSGEIVRYTGTGSIIFDPCPECGGKP